MQDNSTNKLVIESIISRAEEEIKEATGVSAKLIIEPQYVDFDFLHKLADQVTTIWNIQLGTLKQKSRMREMVVYKQIFCMLARNSYRKSSLVNLGKYFNCDHTTILYSIKSGKDMLETNDAYFMAFYEPVKHLFDATDN